MEILIKRKNYDKMMEFLRNSNSDNDWKIFRSCLKNDEDLKNNFTLELLKIKNENDVFFYLNKLIKDSKNDNLLNIILCEILEKIIFENEKFENNFFLRNILISLIAYIFSNNIKSTISEIKLNEIIKKFHFIESSTINVLETLELHKILAVYFENLKEYDKALNYYLKAGLQENDDKIIEIKNTMMNDKDIISISVNSNTNNENENNFESYDFKSIILERNESSTNKLNID